MYLLGWLQLEPFLFYQYEFLSQIGTDIEEYKCSWLVVQALEHADENQKSILNVSVIWSLFSQQIK